ncbi:ABC transporter substrate-binding protein [Paeniglutamicibacter gangotriensis]|uniref:ABC transporter substrate-binding protein n=1 Tax=Paeniglutamicibacter gangotriensis TaxID=254787 RepID=A0A5B0EQ13_9MICC|nr:ABC transporter substrate-binding protein [Paeniglutamicibacter gangotriensis]KAA0979409.1 ABC transporter substrate-binding protein [Paeniglutamicibacter gangotriensis]
MSQPIDAGAMLGGRYQVTEMVLTSADGDQVLSGIDQVLNRPVSILVGSTANASQLATSAREIATGERYAAVQVLDLGISEGSTYLVTNLAEPADLLDLVVQADPTYIEPFYTDTLGTEIFGVARSNEPASYDDDDEYYDDQQAQEEQRPAMLDRLPEISLNEKLNNLKGRFTRGKQVPPAVAPVSPPDTVGSSTEQSPAVPASSAPSPIAPATQAAPKAPPATPTAKPEAPATQATPKAPPATPKVAPVAPVAKAPVKPAPKVTKMEQPEDDVDEPVVTSAAALAAAQKSRGVTVDETGQRVPSSFPAAALGYSDPDEEYENEEADEGGKKTTRLLVGALLCAVLVLAVVFAYNTLGGNKTVPVATESTTQAPTSADASSSEASPSKSAQAVTPEIAGLTRLVPGNQDLNAATDNTLSNAIDGNPASLYKSFSFTSPQYGGLASNMVFIVELEDLSDISEVQLEGLNGTGGSFEIRVGKTDNLSDAKVVSSGSFTGPTVTVPVGGEDSESAQGKYVFLNVTELPRRASGANASRPYGLQIGEFRVS